MKLEIVNKRRLKAVIDGLGAGMFIRNTESDPMHPTIYIRSDGRGKPHCESLEYLVGDRNRKPVYEGDELRLTF